MALSVLVTGGAGFIGGHVVDALVERKRAHVVAVDNFDPFYDPAVKREHWEEVARRSPHGLRPELLEMDIRDGEGLSRLFAERTFDVVIHMAARAGVRPSIADPAGYMDANVTGAARLYDACAKSGVKRVIFASSSSVYGDSTPSPFVESSFPAKSSAPLSMYAVSKRAGELLTATFSRLYGWRSMVLRIFTAYGPWQRPDLAIHRFTQLMTEGLPIPVFGDGSTTRAYTYVGDIVDGVMSAAEWVLASDEEALGTVNLGSDRSVRLDELIAELEAVCGCEAAIDRRPIPPGDVRDTCADLAHAKEVLGYHPKTGLREGLERFFEWYRERL